MRERVGSYRLERRLGGGGMGEVFAAVHDKLERRVAIKFLHPQLCSHPQVVVRFLNEARAVNIVRHPGLVDVYELGQLDDGALYIVMEYLEGQTLAELLREKVVLSSEEAVRIGRQLAAALTSAHARSVVHRDLKPDNIMLVDDGELDGGTRTKILDFGIAKMLGGSSHTPPSGLTRTGHILGTPQYMAPEQCRGCREIDGRADVYSLGLILYEMLASAPPFIAASEWELFAMHVEQQPRPLPPTVKAPLAALIGRMLAKDPEARPAMRDVAVRLGELQTPYHASLPPSLRATVVAAEVEPKAQLAMATTLGGAATELRPITTARRPERRVLWSMCLALLSALSGAAVMHWRGRAVVARPIAPHAPTAAPPLASSLPPSPLPVRWTLTSQPSGATIERSDTGEPLGETPWHREQPPSATSLPLRLTLAGFRPRKLVLDGSHDEHRQVRLEPLRSDTKRTPTGDDDEVQTVH